MLKRGIIVVATAALLGLVMVLTAWRLWTGPGPRPGTGQVPPPDPGSALVRIVPGMTLTAAADTLVSRGLLKHTRVLLAGAKLTGQGRALRAGLYELSFGTSPRDLLRTLTSGTVVQVKVTIPEGLDAASIADLIAGALACDPEKFLATADSLVTAAAEAGQLLPPGTSAAFHDSLLAAESARHSRRFRWCEGHLAPDTFLFSEGTSAEVAARFLVQTQWARVDSVLAAPGAGEALHLSRQELLALASIVEAEARRPDERSRVAAVYVNRLGQGWRLEADPTVAFILNRKGKRLYYRHLEVVSAYNTYRNKGLPPGPIGSPGFAAMAAAAHPDTACRAMYFVSDGQGGHVFSRTSREHEAAVREFRRIRAGGDRRND